METAVIYHDLNEPEPLIEYPLLLPAVLFSPKVIFASDNAQYFEVKELLASLNSEKKAEYLRKVYPNVNEVLDGSDLEFLLKQLRRLQSIKNPSRQVSIDRMAYINFLKKYEEAYLQYVDGSLLAIDMTSLEELNRSSWPHFIELYKTFGDISKAEADENIIKAIGRVLTEPGIIPVMFDDIRNSEFCKPFSTLSDLRNSALYCSDESLFQIPSMEKLTALQFGNFRREMLIKGSRLQCAVEKASLVLRDFRPDDKYESVVTEAFDEIENCMDEFKDAINSSYYVKYLLECNLVGTAIFVYLGVCPALKLLKLYSSEKIISPEVELCLTERYLSRINPESRILLFVIEAWPLKKNT